MRSRFSTISTKNGFTLIELMVSLAIFAFMTAFLLAKYGNFNQNTLLVNLAYDTALTIRSAQSYGLNVQGTDKNFSGCPTNYTLDGTCFYYPYGVHFDAASPNNTKFIFFVDLDDTGKFNSNTTGEIMNTYNMNHGFSIQSLCVGTDAVDCSNHSASALDITFRRPIPDAIINAQIGGVWQSNFTYAKVTLTANGNTSSVVVQSTGAISVGN